MQEIRSVVSEELDAVNAVIVDQLRSDVEMVENVGEYIVERLWRDAKLLEIGGGTLEAHQKNMTRDLAKNPEVILN